MVKDKNIIIRLTADEKNKIENLAKKNGLKTSEYVRIMALEKQPILIDNEERRILKGLSINFNQMVRKMHAEDRFDHISIELQNEILKVLKNAYRKS